MYSLIVSFFKSDQFLVDEGTKLKLYDVLVYVYVPIRENTGELGLPEEDFIKLFEGKLGPSSVAKRLFSLFDADSVNHIDPKEFLTGMALLKFGSTEEKLKSTIYAI